MSTCQDLYDLREETAFCSGLDLHRFFKDLVGQMSPSGKVTLSPEQAKKAFNFVLDEVVGTKNWQPVAQAAHLLFAEGRGEC